MARMINIPDPAISLRFSTRYLLQLAGTIFLILTLSSCALFRRSKDEVDVEKLRLQYQKGKMAALLEIIQSGAG